MKSILCLLFTFVALALSAAGCIHGGGDDPAPAPLAVKLPVLYKITKGDELVLRVAPQAGVSYAWSTGAAGESVTVKPDATTVYTVKATRGAESAMAVTVVEPQ